MKILLSNPPWYKLPDQNSDKPGWLGVRAGSRWPHTAEYKTGKPIRQDYLPFPFFLATATAISQNNGLNAVIRDSIAIGDTYEEFYAFVEEFMPDAVVIETSTPSLYNDLDIAKKIKKFNRRAKVIFTGIHFELENPLFLENHNHLDFVVYGEYETALNSLLLNLAGADSCKGLTDIKNLVYRNGDKVIKNSVGILPPLSELPLPVRKNLPDENYYDDVCGLGRPQLQILTSRGCPFGCIFCVWPQLLYKGKSYRSRDPKSVVDEIENNFNRYPYVSFYIDDDTFNINRKTVLSFVKELKRRRLNHIHWGAMCRADLMDKELLTSLKDAGLYSVKYGVESANQAILNNIDKNLKLNKVIDAVKYTKDIGIKVHLTFTFGLPGDTRESIEETIDLACDLPSDSVQFSIATPFPGTAMFDMYDQKGWITTKEWSLYDGSSCGVTRTEQLSPDQLKKYLHIANRRCVESRINKFIKSDKFTNNLRKEIISIAPPGAKLLVLQSAVYILTHEIITQLLSLGYEVHIMLHERFVPKFLDIIPHKRMHIFNVTDYFNYDTLKSFSDDMSKKYNFNVAIIPYSNPSGGGYSEVKKVAKRSGCKIIAGISSEGTISEI